MIAHGGADGFAHHADALGGETRAAACAKTGVATEAGDQEARIDPAADR